MANCEHPRITPALYADSPRADRELVRVRCVDCGQSWLECTMGERKRRRNGTVEVRP
jgi:hypothetical protein